MPAIKYYPDLTDLINIDDLPEILVFIKDELETVLSKVYYKDLQFSKSIRGDSAFYSMDLVSRKKLAFELPGTGIFLVLNPDQENFDISSFSVTASWEWKILRYKRFFDLENFSFSVQDLFDLILDLLETTEEEVVDLAMKTFVTPASGSVAYIDQIVNDIDSFFSTSIAPLTPSTNRIGDLVSEINSKVGQSSYAAILALYITSVPLADQKDKLKEFLNALLPSDLDDFIKDLLVPKMALNFLDLKLALEFPRTMLVPLDGSNQIEPEPKKSSIIYTAGNLSFDTETGINFESENSFSLTKSKIGKTPLTLEILGLKLDLNDHKNIPEATADGRSNSFKGVFIEEATIGLLLDNDKFPDATAIELYSKNLLIGSEGGLSGTIGIKADVVTHPQHWSSLIIGATGDIVYDDSTKELTITGTRQTMVLDVVTDITGQTETVTMDPSDTMDIRSADNVYYRVVRSGTTITTTITTPSLSPLSIKFGGSGTGPEADANILTLVDFSVTFHQNKIVSSDISGTLYLPKVGDTGTTIAIDVNIENGFHVTFKADPAFEITDNAIFGLTVDFLQIQDTEEFFQVALGNIEPQELGATLTNNIDIPFANKFVPRTFQIDYLAWKKYKDPMAIADDKGFNYSLLFTWDNGLSIPISNLGTALSPLEFRKRFEISKKKEDGFFKLDAIELVIKTEPEPDEGFSGAIELYGAQFNIGKSISFTIDGLGLKTTLTEAADKKGDIGPFDVNFDITGPKGIGVSIKAGPVSGTGYLYIDENEYRGLVQLDISGKFTITAVAVLNTKMPDGGKGNSFITIISVTGLNIPLVMGFVLDGLGGVLGIHRTMDTQFLRDGIREGTLDSLMFPQDVQKNLSKIISDMKSVYPMKRDQFIFGPMAKLYWGGVKSILIADIAILIEFSDPTRIIVLGKAVIGIIVGDFDLIVIRVGVLAELNFTEKKLMIDASIYNSNLVFFTLEGDMALRLYWGEEKAFLLTVGGFHPDYKPSENMKVSNVRRMRIALLNDNPRLTIEAYFAVTSNTVQFGSAVDFYFGIKGFAVKGGFGFDCLFQFNPFQFTVGVYAYLGIYKGNSELMGISLNGSLKGTTPWSVSGSVQFKVLFIKVKGRVDKTWGDNKNTSLPAVAVLPLVADAFNDDKNWQTFVPSKRYLLVTLNDNSKISLDSSGDPALLMSPMSTLTIKQDVVPLGLTLNHYYNQSVSGDKKFAITSIQLGADTDPDHIVYSNSSLTKTKTAFAPAQYFNYSDKDKLKKKSFEDMNNGVSLTANGALTLKHFVEMEYNYDMTLYDGPAVEDEELTWDHRKRLSDLEFAKDYMAIDEFVKGGFITNNSQSQKNNFQEQTVAGNVINQDDDFVIVNKSTFSAHNGDFTAYSASDYSSAQDLMSEVLAGDPDLEDELMVVQKHEIV